MTKAETAVLICGVCSPLGLYIAQPILPQIAGSFTLSPGQAGFAVAAPTFALALAAPLVGSVSDRVGRLPMIMGALVLIVLPTLLAARAGSFVELLLWQVLLGFLTPAISAVALAYVGDEFSPERGARLTALFISANVTGGFIGRYVSAVAAGQYSWRASFVAVAILQFLGCATVATLLPASKKFKQSRNLSTALTSMARHVTNPALAATFIVGFGVLFCIVGVFSYLGFRLADAPYLLPPASIGSLYILYGLSILLNPVAGRLIATIGPRRTFISSATVAVCGLAFTMADSLTVVVVGLAIFVVAAFACQSAATNNVLRNAREARSAASGLYMSFYYVGGAAGAVLPGFVWSHFGWTATASLFVAVVAASAAIAYGRWQDSW